MSLTYTATEQALLDKVNLADVNWTELADSHSNARDILSTGRHASYRGANMQLQFSSAAPDMKAVNKAKIHYLYEKTALSAEETETLKGMIAKHEIQTEFPELHVPINEEKLTSEIKAAVSEIEHTHAGKTDFIKKEEPLAEKIVEKAEQAAETAKKEGSWVSRNKILTGVIAGVGILGIGAAMSRSNKVKEERAQAQAAGMDFAR